MNYLFKYTALLIGVLFYSTIVFGQSGEIKIKFIGNCGMYLTDGNTHLYTDFPYESGAHKYMEYDAAQLDSLKDNAIFLFTHKHTDHYSKKLVKKLNGKIYANQNTEELEALTNSIPDFSIQAIKTPHKFTFKHYSYLITWHGKKIYINGDTGDTEPISKIKNIDWAFVPYWLYINARDENITIDTKMFGMYHIAPIQIQGIKDPKPENVHFLIKQNEVITIPY